MKKNILHNDCFKYLNNRPKYLKNKSGDCSTRCIAFCINAKYKTIELEQRQLESDTGWFYNSNDLWDTPLRKRGWLRLYFRRKVKKWKLAQITSMINCKIAVHSNGHVCSIYHGKIFDLKPTQNEFADYILVKQQYMMDIRRLLIEFC